MRGFLQIGKALQTIQSELVNNIPPPKKKKEKKKKEKKRKQKNRD